MLPLIVRSLESSEGDGFGLDCWKDGLLPAAGGGLASGLAVGGGGVAGAP